VLNREPFVGVVRGESAPDSSAFWGAVATDDAATDASAVRPARIAASQVSKSLVAGFLFAGSLASAASRNDG